jgi:hypothetical protein
MLTRPATHLAGELIRQGALPQRATVDAFHIAIAAAHQVNYLLTWNCKHLANATMRGTIQSICRSVGLRPPVICTPEELQSDSTPMKRRDPILEDLHKLREKIGRAHDFDVHRIAATVRRHESQSRKTAARRGPGRSIRHKKAP